MQVVMVHDKIKAVLDQHPNITKQTRKLISTSPIITGEEYSKLINNMAASRLNTITKLILLRRNYPKNLLYPEMRNELKSVTAFKKIGVNKEDIVLILVELDPIQTFALKQQSPVKKAAVVIDPVISSDQFSEAYLLLPPNISQNSCIKFTFIEPTEGAIMLQIMQIIYSSICAQLSTQLPCPILYPADNNASSNGDDDQKSNGDDDQKSNDIDDKDIDVNDIDDKDIDMIDID